MKSYLHENVEDALLVINILLHKDIRRIAYGENPDAHTLSMYRTIWSCCRSLRMFLHGCRYELLGSRVLRPEEDLHFCYYLLSVTFRHALKVELLPRKYFSIAASGHLADDTKTAFPNNIERLIIVEYGGHGRGRCLKACSWWRVVTRRRHLERRQQYSLQR